MIRLTKAQAADFGYKLITPWYAIQPIEIKDGTFILPEDILNDLNDFEIRKIKTAKPVNDILKTFPIRKLEKDELKDYDIVANGISI